MSRGSYEYAGDYATYAVAEGALVSELLGEDAQCWDLDAECADTDLVSSMVRA